MKRRLKTILAYTLILVSMLCVLTASSQKSEALNHNRENIFYFLKNNMELSTASAIGILTNIQKESSFNPNATGDNGTSYGICQWHDSRWQDLKDYCTTNGYDWTTLTGQLYYLEYELETSYPNTYRMIREVENTSQGAYDAAYYFCRYYEIPANAEENAKKRGQLAQDTYWPIYGYAEDFIAPKLNLDSEYTSVSSRNAFSLSWSKATGEFDRYKLHIVKCIDETVKYDWDNLDTYTVSSNKTSYTISPAAYSAGNYLAYVYAYDTSTEKRSDYSNFIYFSVYDEIIYECESPADGAIYDAQKNSKVTAKGWAVNTGKKDVSFYLQLDDGEKEALTNVARDEIYETYSQYCTSNKIGYSWSMSTKDISNGKHTLTIYLESETLSGVLSQITFTVKNSHEHSFTNYVYDKNASYSADGTKTAKCDFCNTTKTLTAEGTKLTLGKTKSITTDVGDTSITLTWKSVKGATGYRVYKYDGGWKKLKDTTALSYKVTNIASGTDYTFAVKAYVKEDGKTIWASSYRKVSLTTPPLAPKTLTATQTTSSITLKWSKSSGATNYRVYRYVSGKWKAIKTTTATSYKVTGLKSGTKYTFAVKPYRKTSSGKVWAETYTKLVTATKTKTPSIKLASTAKGRATIAWNNVSGESGYQVWYSTKKSSGFKKISNYKADTVKVYKKGLKSGKTYYFKVRAYKKVDEKYIYSSYSSVKSLKIK